MPYPFKFKYESNNMSDKEFGDIMLSRNKTVDVRPSVSAEILRKSTPFGDVTRKGYFPQTMPFNDAWDDIKMGKKVMYFDNSWRGRDFLHIMSQSAYETLNSASSIVASFFLSDYEEDFLTATAHASFTPSVATQVINTKTWIFFNPKALW